MRCYRWIIDARAASNPQGEPPPAKEFQKVQKVKVVSGLASGILKSGI
jgi:hypothetical protein